MNTLAAVGATLLLAGCTTERSLYEWGSYQDTIRYSSSSPDNADVELQVERLEQDLQAARAANHRLPPGWHAHLGCLYSQLGDRDAAAVELQKEEAEFPESTAFVDHLLTNLAKP